jgi:hypothetical protein
LICCAITDAVLNDHFDRRLPIDEAQRVDRHLDECAECRNMYQKLITLRTLADGLPASMEPARDLWPEIAARLFGPGSKSGKRRRSYWTWMLFSAAAATLLVAAAVLKWLDEPGQPPIVAQHSAVVPARDDDDRLRQEVAKAEQTFQDAAGEFLTQLKSADGTLPPDTKVILQGNLIIADKAISEVKTAWEKQPDNYALARKLLEAHERRVELLQQVAHLSIATQNGG